MWVEWMWSKWIFEDCLVFENAESLLSENIWLCLLSGLQIHFDHIPSVLIPNCSGACRHCRWLHQPLSLSRNFDSRFQKCLTVGMDRGAIQQSRDPIGYTKRASRYPRANRIQPPSLKNTPTVQNLHTTRIISSLNGGTSEKTAADLMLEKLTRVETQINLARNTEDIVHKSLITAVVSPSSIFDNIDLLKQLNTVCHFKCSTQRYLGPTGDRCFATSAELWLYIVAWTRLVVNDWMGSMVSFNSSSLMCLPYLEDNWSVCRSFALKQGKDTTYTDLESLQLALLRHSAITHPSLIQCFYTPDRGPDTIVFPNGAYFDRNPEPGRLFQV